MKRTAILAVVAAGLLVSVPPVRAAAVLKPYVLGATIPGNVQQVASTVESRLRSNGFSVVGKYSPYPDAQVIVVTCPELLSAASHARFGGFGAGQRVAVTLVNGAVQVTYMNPAYLGAAYGLGSLAAVKQKLGSALGAVREFGANSGLTAQELAPGTFHYMTGMPYFHNLDRHAQHESQQAAVDAVESSLASGAGGTKKVYRIDLPGRNATVFGVAIDRGDGDGRGLKDTDRELMTVVDRKSPRATAYLPCEILVDDGAILSLRGQYRVALHFPDTPLKGAHGFMEIVKASGGIKKALAKVATGPSALSAREPTALHGAGKEAAEN